MLDLLVGATIGLHVASVHIPARDFNDVNPGVYVKTANDLVVGTYYNSERRQSFYAGKNFAWGRWSVTAGAITGYGRGPVLPLLVPGVTLWGARVTVIPPVVGMPTVVHLSYEWKIQ